MSPGHAFKPVGTGSSFLSYKIDLKVLQEIVEGQRRKGKQSLKQWLCRVGVLKFGGG